MNDNKSTSPQSTPNGVTQDNPNDFKQLGEYTRRSQAWSPAGDRYIEHDRDVNDTQQIYQASVIIDVIFSTCFIFWFFMQLHDVRLQNALANRFANHRAFLGIGYLTSIICFFALVALYFEFRAERNATFRLNQRPLWTFMVKGLSLLSIMSAPFFNFNKTQPLMLVIGLLLFLLMVSDFYSRDDENPQRCCMLSYQFLLGFFLLPQISSLAIFYIYITQPAFNFSKNFLVGISIIGLTSSILFTTFMICIACKIDSDHSENQTINTDANDGMPLIRL